MNIYISHNGNYDYVNELYAPIKASEMYGQHHLFLPHEPENADIAGRDELKQTDLLVAEASYPSTGQGIELGLASTMNVPIICFYKTGTKPSSSLRFVTNEIVEYSDIQDLLSRIEARIA